AAFTFVDTHESISIFETVEAWAIPIIGSLMAQELASKTLAARSETVARRATVGAGLLYLVVGIIPVALGALARVELPGLEEGDQVLPAFAAHHLGTIGQLIFVGALLSAVLSTVDSALLVAGSVFAHNFIGPVSGGRVDPLAHPRPPLRGLRGPSPRHHRPAHLRGRAPLGRALHGRQRAPRGGLRLRAQLRRPGLRWPRRSARARAPLRRGLRRARDLLRHRRRERARPRL